MSIETPAPDQSQVQAPAMNSTAADNIAQAANQVPSGGTAPSTPAPPTSAPAPTADPSHPSSIFHKMLETLGGGPQIKYTEDASGKMQATKVPTSGGDLAKTILAGALTGLFASAGKHGPGAALSAFGAGGQAVQEKQQQQEAQQKNQAHQDYLNQQQGQLQKAQIAEANSRLILNTAQAEKLGGEAMDDYIASHKDAADSMSTLADGGEVRQSEISDGLKTGKYHTVNDIFLPTGKTQVIGPDGQPTGKMEVTFTHYNNGPVNLSQQLYDDAARAGVPKFQLGTKIAATATIPASQVISIQQQISGVNMAQHEVAAVNAGLGIKDKVDWSKTLATPGMATALMKFQPYLHATGDDPMSALSAMTANKKDAQFANLVTQAFGGGERLKAYHDKMVADSERSKEYGKTQGGLSAAIAKEDNVAMHTEDRAEARDERKAARDAAASDVSGHFNISANDTPEQIKAKLPPTLGSSIQAMLNYENNPASFPSRLPSKSSKPDQVDRQTAIGIAKLMDPTFDDTQYDSRRKMRMDYTSGKPGSTGGNVRAINTAIHHMNELKQSSDKMYSFGFHTLNATKNSLTPGFLKAGAQVPTKMDINAVTQEVANVFKGASATDPELNSWKDSISLNATHSEFNAWIKEGMRLMAGRASSIAGGWQNGMQKPYDFGLVTPEARAALKNLPGGDQLLDSMGVAGAGGAEAKDPGGQIPVGAQTIMKGGRAVGYIQNGVRTNL